MTEKTIGAHYTLQDKLGEGGMGTVYLGLDTHTQQTVAIKQLKSDIAQPDMIERFRREGEALRELNHPNIVKMLDMFEHGGQHYLVMEYVSGGDLSQLLEQGQMPLEQILKLSIDLADALTRAHKLDIIHRDLKPANVLIGDDGVLRLTDFGVAHVGSKERVTDTGMIVGTIDYLPPEAFDGQLFDARGDIWAFGVMLFEMLSGIHPFTSDTIMQVLQNIANEPIPDLESLKPELSIDIIDLVYRMLERDPQARVSSVRHVGASLEDILQGRETSPSFARFEVSTSTKLQRPKYNLPVVATAFIGREYELAELTRLLDNPDLHMITLLAPGGMGKSSLALALGERYVNSDQFPDGVWFVELAPLSSADSIPSAIADTLGYQFQQDGRKPLDQILDYLANKDLLLIMDNYEHVLDGAGIVGDILKIAPDITVLATSRERLNLVGEQIFALSGMDFPDWETPEDALEYAAVKLFMQSAKRIRPDFELDIDELPYLTRICRLVAGMPLAVVLAAAWVESLSLEDIAEEIADSLDILETDLRDIPKRQQSIQAVFEYSWRRLTPPEKDIFAKLSVFRSGMTYKAAKAVAGGKLRTLQTLVNKGLLRRDVDSGRYHIHGLVLQFASQQLAESNQVQETQQAHAQYFSDWLSRYESSLKGTSQLDALNTITIEFENIVVAWVWCVDNAKQDYLVAMMDSLYLFCTLHGRAKEGIELFGRARTKWQLPSSDPIIGRLAVRFPEESEPERQSEVIQRSLAIAQDSQNIAEVAFCERQLGLVYGHGMGYDLDQIEHGLVYFQQSLDNYRAIGDDFYIGHVLDEMGWSYGLTGNVDKKLETIELSIEIRRKIGDKIGLGNALRQLATARWEGSIQTLQQAYDLAEEMGNYHSMAWSKTMIGLRYWAKGDFETAMQSLEAGIVIATDIHDITVIRANKLIQSAVMCMQHENYTQAEKLMNETLPGGSKEAQSRPELFIFGTLTFSILYAVQGDLSQLQSNLQLAVSFVSQVWLTYYLAWQIPSYAVYLFLNQRYQHATQMLAFAMSYDTSVNGWAHQSDFLTQLQHELRTELGEEVYQSAWEQGKLLDRDMILQDILTEFGDDT